MSADAAVSDVVFFLQVKSIETNLSNFYSKIKCLCQATTESSFFFCLSKEMLLDHIYRVVQQN